MIRTLSLLLIVLIASGISAQEIIYESYAGKVDLHLIMPYNSLIFMKDRQTTTYQITLQVRNSKKKQIASFEHVLSVGKHDWLDYTALPISFRMDLEPGTYHADLKLRNKESGDKRTFKKQFTIGKESTELGMSWIVAKREGVSFIPASLHNLSPLIEELSFKQSFSTVIDSLRITIDSSTLMVANPQSPITLDLKQYLIPGQPNRLKFAFYEKNILYNLEPFLFSPWFSYSLRYSYQDQMAQIRYIATQNEWQVLRQLPKDKYHDAIESFWKTYDPSPGTIRNETREKFCQRVLMADEMFKVHKKLTGWSSDRGRIYIKYGEPDEITNDAFPLGRYPSIIWTYYKQNLEFIFTDTGGFGLYTLRNKEDEY